MKKTILLITLLIGTAAQLMAQYSSFGRYKLNEMYNDRSPFLNFLSRIELNGGYSLFYLRNKVDMYQTNERGAYSFDSSYTYKMDAANYSFGLSSYFPLVGLGPKSIMALQVGVNYQSYEVKYPKNYFGKQAAPDNATTFPITIISVPIGIEYKYGCDAANDRGTNICASFGAGLAPQYIMTDDFSTVKVTPYAMGEFGTFIGMAVKLRITTYLPNITYFKSDREYGGNKVSQRLYGNTPITFGLVLMPFSWSWENSKW
jgi:hypothetical protein